MKKWILSLLALLLHYSADVYSVYWGVALEGYPIEKRQLTKTSDETNVIPKIVEFYLMWPEKQKQYDADFPLSSFENIWDIGAVPCLTWEPMYLENGSEKTVKITDLLLGKYDTYLKDFAKNAKKWEKPFLIRFAHEMNLSRYHWGTSEEKYSKKSPHIYKQMFRYIINFFKKEKVENVLWVFCPNSDSIPQKSWNTISHYYPGDAYVDILGIDGYNWGDSQKKETHGWISSEKSFHEIFSSSYLELKKLSPNKPIMIFETASVGSQEEKQLWLKDALDWIEKWNLSGLIWFQVDKEQNWKLSLDRNSFLVQQLQKEGSMQTWVKEKIYEKKRTH